MERVVSNLHKAGDRRESESVASVPLDQWPAELLNPHRSVSVDLFGAPGVFPAPAGWSVRVERLDSHLMYHVVNGGFEAQVDGQPIHAAAGSVFWVGPGRSLAARRVDDQPLVLLRFRFMLSGSGVAYGPPQAVVHRPRLPEARGWFEAIVIEAQRDDDHVDTRVRSLLGCLLVEIARHPAEPEAERRLNAAQQRALQEHVARRLTDWPDLAQLAAVVDLSPDYFSRLFRRTYGRSVRQWLVDQRIRLARLYLAESDHDVTSVAAMLGYNDVFYFSRQFKQRVGLSPSAYRRHFVHAPAISRRTNRRSRIGKDAPQQGHA